LIDRNRQPPRGASRRAGRAAPQPRVIRASRERFGACSGPGTRATLRLTDSTATTGGVV